MDLRRRMEPVEPEGHGEIPRPPDGWLSFSALFRDQQQHVERDMDDAAVSEGPSVSSELADLRMEINDIQDAIKNHDLWVQDAVEMRTDISDLQASVKAHEGWMVHFAGVFWRFQAHQVKLEAKLAEIAFRLEELSGGTAEDHCVSQLTDIGLAARRAEDALLVAEEQCKSCIDKCRAIGHRELTVAYSLDNCSKLDSREGTVAEMHQASHFLSDLLNELGLVQVELARPMQESSPSDKQPLVGQAADEPQGDTAEAEADCNMDLSSKNTEQGSQTGLRQNELGIRQASLAHT
mmetsp:Transcript_21836/g.60982  ORF Transcript_21836/g.60982 Transcript_21836/m.60982 type:complete len:293 (+) Transcript_21836:86-964(+)